MYIIDSSSELFSRISSHASDAPVVAPAYAYFSKAAPAADYIPAAAFAPPAAAARRPAPSHSWNAARPDDQREALENPQAVWDEVREVFSAHGAMPVGMTSTSTAGTSPTPLSDTISLYLCLSDSVLWKIMVELPKRALVEGFDTCFRCVKFIAKVPSHTVSLSARLSAAYA